ncbi:anti-sigma factor [Roseomonas sp. AR75]|uniref:anti-sigma factor family protein n=1 Tax=Roseomonas sp. AR75 TaxID=2562311 RepID=UPI0010C101E2|nr:anti-sigma factor [Roseomonas sp. AR75]
MAADPTPPIGEDDLHALVDGVLDPARLPAVQRYLAERPDEAARVQDFTAQRHALRAALDFKAREPIPARLRVANLREARGRAARQRWRMAGAAAVLVVMGSGLGWTLRGSMEPRPDATAALQRATAEAPAPPLQAMARDTDLGLWLFRRLGEPFPPPDLTGFGFALETAFVLPGRDGHAAQLRYVDGAGTALSLWRRPSPDPVPRQLRCVDEPGGLLTYSWSNGETLYAVTAALERDRLRPIAQALERAMEAPASVAGPLAGRARRPCDAALG